MELNVHRAMFLGVPWHRTLPLEPVSALQLKSQKSRIESFPAPVLPGWRGLPVLAQAAFSLPADPIAF